jgi:hypothetical protein
MLLLPDLEIRAHLSKFLAGSITLDEFEAWFMAETWDIENSGSIGAVKLAAEVRSGLFALTTGEESEDVFREMARKKVREVIALPAPEPQPSSGAPSIERLQAVRIGS